MLFLSTNIFSLAVMHDTFLLLIWKSTYLQHRIVAGYEGHKDADKGGKVIARAAVQGENRDLFLRIVDDEGRHDEFDW